MREIITNMFKQMFFFSNILLETEFNEIGRYLCSNSAPLDLYIGTTGAISNRSGKYDISLHLLKVFDKGPENNSIIILNILVGISRLLPLVKLSPQLTYLISIEEAR